MTALTARTNQAEKPESHPRCYPERERERERRGEDDGEAEESHTKCRSSTCDPRYNPADKPQMEGEMKEPIMTSDDRRKLAPKESWGSCREKPKVSRGTTPW